jgi:hypothetical protein
MKKQIKIELTQREIDMIIQSLKAYQFNLIGYNSHINDQSKNKKIVDCKFLESKFGKYKEEA